MCVVQARAAEAKRAAADQAVGGGREWLVALAESLGAEIGAEIGAAEAGGGGGGATGGDGNGRLASVADILAFHERRPRAAVGVAQPAAVAGAVPAQMEPRMSALVEEPSAE